MSMINQKQRRGKKKTQENLHKQVLNDMNLDLRFSWMVFKEECDEKNAWRNENNKIRKNNR